MSCMKCGRELEEGQVFCQECLEGMAKYPVKPGTVVMLPKRSTAHAPKKSHAKRRSYSSPEDKIRAMKKWLRFMLIMWLLTLGLLIFSLFPAVEYFLGNSFHHIGQNYTTVIETEATEP